MRAHPYAEAWPLLGGDDLAELAADIKANGLLNPIITLDSMILDGRNRFAACELAGIVPVFLEFEGADPLAFVLAVNGARRHQSKGSRAASWALTMLAAGRRENGRWQYGDATFPESGKSWSNTMSQLGTIADYAPDLLVAVRDDLGAVNFAYQTACEVRDEQLQKAEAERQAVEAEAKAERFIRDSAPDLVEHGEKHSFLEAEAMWKVRNTEEAKARAEAERKAKQIEQERIDALKREAERVTYFTRYWHFMSTLATHPERDEILALLRDDIRDEFLRIEREYFE